MSRIRGVSKWHVVVPIVDRPIGGGGGFYTDFRIAGEVDAPTFERAIEQAEKIAEPYVNKYLEETPTNSYHHIIYDKGGRIWRVQPLEVWAGTKMGKYV